MTPLITVLKALSDETRIRLLQLLLAEVLCGRALARRLGISEAAVSQHLKVLKEAGLVEGEKRGYWNHYSVQAKAIKETIRELERLASQSAVAAGQCHRLHAIRKGCDGREVKTMCQCCCERPEKLKGKPEECTPEQIRECHGDERKHPCKEGEKKKGK
jgi:ArsR family transcriptional regulator, arsenate/arsenite/antimonite-responsive transcriptional repressor